MVILFASTSLSLNPHHAFVVLDYVHTSVKKSPSHKLVTISYYNPTNLFKEAEKEESSKLYVGGRRRLES